METGHFPATSGPYVERAFAALTTFGESGSGALDLADGATARMPNLQSGVVWGLSQGGLP
jgi:hypothetical protein